VNVEGTGGRAKRREAPQHAMLTFPQDDLGHPLRATFALERDFAALAVLGWIKSALHAAGGYLKRSAAPGALFMAPQDAQPAIVRLLAAGVLRERDEDGALFSPDVLAGLEKAAQYRADKAERGRRGGLRRAETMTAAQLSELGKRAARARWPKSGRSEADAEEVPSGATHRAKRKRADAKLSVSVPIPISNERERPVAASPPAGGAPVLTGEPEVHTERDPLRLVNLLGKEPGSEGSKLEWLRGELPNIELLAAEDHPDDPKRQIAAIRSRVLRHYRQHLRRPGSQQGRSPAAPGSRTARRELARRLYTVEDLLPDDTLEALAEWERRGSPREVGWWLPPDEAERMRAARAARSASRSTQGAAHVAA
jgi:hypothetical protein